MATPSISQIIRRSLNPTFNALQGLKGSVWGLWISGSLMNQADAVLMIRTTVPKA